MEPIIDCSYTLEEALAGSKAPKEILNAQQLLTVQYYSYDGKIHQGQLVMHEAVACDITEIFEELLKLQFPIERVVPIVFHNWNDDIALQENTTSAFNYRVIKDTTELSNHSFGKAIDINPATNPYTLIDGSVLPVGAEYKPGTPGTLQDGDAVVELFTSRGWRWLGHRTEQPDWQHFDKAA